MKRKVLQVTVHLGGGVGKAILGAALYKNELFETEIVLLEKPEKTDIIEKAKKENIKIYIDFQKNVVEKLIKDADIIVINWWGHPIMSEFLYYFPAIECRMMIWVHVNGCTYPYLPFEFLKQFEYILFTTKYSYENMLWSRNELKIIQKKSTVIYGSGDFSPHNMITKETYKKKRDFVLGYVGTLNYSKLNIEYIKYCEAAAERCKSLKILLAGEYDKNVLKDIENSWMKRNFKLLGYVKNVEKLYLSFDVFAYILNENNYGTTENVILEAMAYGIPVIAYDGKVERTIIDNGVDGFLVHSSNEFSEYIKLLAEDIELQRTIGQAGRKKVCRGFSCQENRKRLLECYRIISLNNKRKYSFMNIFGNKPLEWFLYFTGKDREIFETYLKCSNEETKRQLINIQPIYR